MEMGAIFRKDVFMEIPDKEKACRMIDTFPENYFKSKIIRNWNFIDVFIEKWKQLMYQVSEELRHVWASNKQCKHYVLCSHRVSKKEMLQKILLASYDVRLKIKLKHIKT